MEKSLSIDEMVGTKIIHEPGSGILKIDIGTMSPEKAKIYLKQIASEVMKNILISDEEMKKQDNGSIQFMSKIMNKDGSYSYLVTLNIFPYRIYEVPQETFEEWTQFCDLVPSNIAGVPGEHYKIKHWSKLL